jgi:hypothetical protein
MFFRQIVLIFLLLTGAAWAKFDDLYIGVGNMSKYIDKVQVDSAGATETFNMNPLFKIEARIDLSPSWYWLPELALVLPQDSRDSMVHKQIFLVMPGFGYRMDATFMLHTGLGLQFTHIYGDGGTKSLNNGTSTTSFPVPGRNVLTSNAILNLGGEYFFNQDFSGRLELSAMNVLIDNQRITFNYFFMVHYHFGEIIW